MVEKNGRFAKCTNLFIHYAQYFFECNKRKTYNSYVIYRKAYKISYIACGNRKTIVTICWFPWEVEITLTTTLFWITFIYGYKAMYNWSRDSSYLLLFLSYLGFEYSFKTFFNNFKISFWFQFLKIFLVYFYIFGEFFTTFGLAKLKTNVSF